MSLCEVCYLREASARCRLCGRQVCRDCLLEDGRCVVCAETICELCGERHALATCTVCGRRVCEMCSVQLDPVTRVCRECLARGARIDKRPRRELVLFVERFMREQGAR